MPDRTALPGVEFSANPEIPPGWLFIGYTQREPGESDHDQIRRMLLAAANDDGVYLFINGRLMTGDLWEQVRARIEVRDV